MAALAFGKEQENFSCTPYLLLSRFKVRVQHGWIDLSVLKTGQRLLGYVKLGKRVPTQARTCHK
jgi:hypothetical protein